MVVWSVRKKQIAHVAKRLAPVAAVGLMASVGAHAGAPDVTDVVSDIDALEAPVALVGGAYIGLKVFKRGWQIIRGFI